LVGGDNATAVTHVLAAIESSIAVEDLFLWRAFPTIESNLSIALNEIDILYFGGNAPEIAAPRPVKGHAPLEDPALIGKIKRDGGFKDRALIFSDYLLHRGFRPVIRIPTIAVPTTAQAGVAKDRPFQTGDELKLTFCMAIAIPFRSVTAV